MPAAFTARPELVGTFGMVASTHWLASAVGMAMLERGGNAFDAAVAAGFTLHVCEPHLNGPGGDIPILIYSAREDRVRAVCGQGVTPAGATIAHYRDKLGLDLVPGTGLLATCVPGMFDGWATLLRDYGTMSLADVLAPAISYAENGCPLVARAVETIGNVRAFFEAEWPTSAALWLPGGKPPEPGRPYRNPTLAKTYARIVREASAKSGREAQIDAARDLWYRGFVAEAIDEFCRTQAVMDTSGRRHRGVLNADDMARWHATVEDPVKLDYGRYTAFKCGPWTQGPVLLQQLALLRNFDLDAMDPLGPDFVHTVVECMKLAFADREGFYADPNFVDVPLDGLLSASYNRARAALVGERASRELRVGTVGNHAGWVPPTERAAGPQPEFVSATTGEPTVRRDGTTGGDTCHVDVIDRWGNMVSATPSGGWLQSSPTIPEIGFCLGTRMQMFWLDESAPTALMPSRRPRSTLSPSFAYRDGKPYMAFGTPGGDQQDQWALTFFLRHVHHGMNLQEAIEAPAFTSEHWPNSFWPRAAKPARLLVEGRMPKATVDELKRRGHDIEVGADWSLGRLSAVTRDGDAYKAGANPRGMQGYAVGR
ncbi:MAG TPA: gamma-glutamyltransferase family protein [Candidatus Sulfotelmatobacter sp.]|nr:gamma-glutamyltransferase family protein [Candidatus Sulfotelmatobacter sp.]